jgi:hypothetical protein
VIRGEEKSYIQCIAHYACRLYKISPDAGAQPEAGSFEMTHIYFIVTTKINYIYMKPVTCKAMM